MPYIDPNGIQIEDSVKIENLTYDKDLETLKVGDKYHQHFEMMGMDFDFNYTIVAIKEVGETTKKAFERLNVDGVYILNRDYIPTKDKRTLLTVSEGNKKRRGREIVYTQDV